LIIITRKIFFGGALMIQNTRQTKDQRGFTMIEIISVLLIIAIIAVVAVVGCPVPALMIFLRNWRF